MKIDVVGIRLVKEREIDYDKAIKKPLDTVNFVLEEMQDLDREMCMTLNLDAKQCVLNAHVVSVGGLDGTIVDIKSVMKSALLSNAHGIIMYHNHPSGNSTPSREDFLITEKIQRACEIMDIKFLDHIIIGRENYYSIKGEYTRPYDTSKRKGKYENTIRVLTIQSSDLDVSKKEFADKDRCNYQEALPVYRRLFDDYNRMKETNYPSFFWGFSKLKTKDMNEAIERASEMIGEEIGNSKIYVLDIPSELCLETDFYNFTDEIYAYQYPNEMESVWNSIYEKRNSERQVIFPYIEPSMIVGEIKQGKFIEYDHEGYDLEFDEIEK
ncbi:JAB domain-containing protein [[Clostridium] innocuum]|nr:JAB domain-containing protein [[Clostridium] innocuum]